MAEVTDSGGGGNSSRKAKTTDPVFEHYDVETSDTFTLGEDRTVGFYKAVTFTDCIRQDTVFQNCTFINVAFEGCDFRDTMFANVFLRDVTVKGCEFEGITWMDDRLQELVVTPRVLKGMFGRKVRVGKGVPMEVLDAGWLQMQLALADGSYIHLDEALAQRLQLEEESKPFAYAWKEDETPRQKWTEYTSSTVNPPNGGPVIGELSHRGAEARVVTGFDQYGYPIVEHPYFPCQVSSQVAGIALPGSSDHDTASLPELLEGETYYEEEPAAPGFVDKAVEATDTASGSSNTQDHAPQRELTVERARHVNTATAAKPAKTDLVAENVLGSFRPRPPGKQASMPHFPLAFVERRKREAAEAAEAAKLNESTARLQSTTEVARIATWKAGVRAAQQEAEEREAARLRDRERMCLTEFASAPGSKLATYKASLARKPVSTVPGTDAKGRSVDKHGFAPFVHPYFAPVADEAVGKSACESATNDQKLQERRLDGTKWPKATTSRGVLLHSTAAVTSASSFKVTPAARPLPPTTRGTTGGWTIVDSRGDEWESD